MKKLVAKLGLSDISPAVLVLVTSAIVIVIGLLVLTNFQNSETLRPGTAGCNATATTSCGAAFNATGDAIEGVTQVSDQYSTLGIIIIAVIILGLVFGGLAVARFRG